ncbi:FHA domain-containing protein [uncultured Actinomyces sp.]|uniref:FHA domain-containing protein n=1 Tax=uncultured Actinomyces sp. TaxID=249061 RepID=UPI0026210FD1|nr:FHA domain-containing protein [uncultured Actinomyces sp.]
MLQLGRHAVRGNGGFIVAGPLGFALVPAELADSAQRLVNDSNEDLATWVNHAASTGLPFAHMDLRGAVPLLSLGGSANVRAVAPGYETPFTWGGPLSMWEFVPGEWTIMDIALSSFDDSQQWVHFADTAAEASQVRVGYPVEPELSAAPASTHEAAPEPAEEAPQVQEESVEPAATPEPEAQQSVWEPIAEPVVEAPVEEDANEPAPQYLWAPEPEADNAQSEDASEFTAGAQVAATQAVLSPAAAPVYTSPEALEATITSEAFAAMQDAAAQEAATQEPAGAETYADAPQVEEAGESYEQVQSVEQATESTEVPQEFPVAEEEQAPAVSETPAQVEEEPQAEVTDVTPQEAPVVEESSDAASAVEESAQAGPLAPAFELDNADTGATVLRRVSDDSAHTSVGYLVYAGAAPVELTHDVILGRDPNARVLTGRPAATVMRVPSPANEISRSHAAVMPSGFCSWMLMDLGSANGTLLRSSNGNVQDVPPRVTVALNDGDVIDLGENVLVEFIVR